MALHNSIDVLHPQMSVLAQDFNYFAAIYAHFAEFFAEISWYFAHGPFRGWRSEIAKYFGIIKCQKSWHLRSLVNSAPMEYTGCIPNAVQN